MFYRGYYIDGITFTTEADVDAFIKATNIRLMQKFNAAMLAADNADTMMVFSKLADDTARYLHDHCGMSWTEIEAVEFAA